MISHASDSSERPTAQGVSPPRFRLPRPRLTLGEQLSAPVHDFPIRDEILYQYAPEISGLRILEIGPGSGFTAYGLAPLVAEMKLIDLSEATIQDLRQKVAQRGSVTFLQADIAIPGLSARIPERYDLIFGLDVFEYVQDAEACLHNLWTILDSRGVLFLSFPNQPVEKKNGVLRFHTTGELLAMLARAGFSRSEVLSVAMRPFAQRMYIAFHEWPLCAYRWLRRTAAGQPQTYEATWAFQHRSNFAFGKLLLNCYWLFLGALLHCAGDVLQTKPLGNEALGHQLVVSAFK
ncbi:MAG: class I SAM-dependent methyltransferase [Terriglobales bacterium]